MVNSVTNFHKFHSLIHYEMKSPLNFLKETTLISPSNTFKLFLSFFLKSFLKKHTNKHNHKLSFVIKKFMCIVLSQQHKYNILTLTLKVYDNIKIQGFCIYLDFQSKTSSIHNSKLYLSNIEFYFTYNFKLSTSIRFIEILNKSITNLG